MNKKGSITIFLALVFFTLISFILSIYEITRIQILDIEASQLLVFSGNSVLGAYDSTLKNEYGIFARDLSYSDVDFIYPSNEINETFYGSVESAGADVKDDASNQKLSKDLAYYLGENLKGSDFASAKVSANGVSTLRSPSARAYLKSEILNYTKVNIGLTKIKNLLENYDVFLKIGKTTVFEGKKNEIVRKAGKLESDYSKLYLYLDGVDVHGTRGRNIINNYVNRLVRSKKNPNKVPSSMQKGGYVDLMSILNGCKKSYQSILDAQIDLGALYTKFRPINEEYNSLKSDISSLNSEISALRRELEDCQSELGELKGGSHKESKIRTDIDAIKKEIKSLNLEKRELSRYLSMVSDERQPLYEKISNKLNIIEIASVYLRENYFIFKDLVKDNHDNVINSSDYTQSDDGKDMHNSYLSNSIKIREIINRIQENGGSLGKDIDKFINSEKDNKDEYVRGSYHEAERTLNKIKAEYGSVLKESFDEKGNLKLIRKIIDKNINLIESVKEDISYLDENLYKGAGFSFKSNGVDKDILMYLNEASVKSDKIIEFINKIDFTSSDGDSYIPKINRVIDAMVNYENVGGLSYENALNTDNISFKKHYETLKQIYEDIYTKIGEAFLPFDEYRLPNDLPSLGALVDESEFKLNTDLEGEGVSKLDDEASVKIFSSLENVFNAKNFIEKLLISEYAINMFRAYPDKFLKRESISGHEIKDHIFSTELEYILTGIASPENALAYVVSQIYAMRIALNTIFLLTSPKKTQEILNFANMVAGWWSLGTGTIILSVVITLLWAAIESGIDVVIMLHGGDLPIFKTDASWFTSLDGLSLEGYRAILKTGEKITSGLANKIIKDVPKGVQATVNEMMDIVGDVQKENINRATNGIFKKVYDASNMETEKLDLVFEEAIVEAISNKSAGKDVFADSRGQFEDLSPEETGIINKARSIIEKAEIAQGEYSDYVRLKTKVKKELAGEIIALKDDVKEKHFGFLDGLLEDSKAEVGEIIEAAESNTEELVGKRIEKVFEDIDKRLVKKYGELADGGEKFYLPRLDYYDHILLFMLINSDKDDILDRILDMIDINISATKRGHGPKSMNEMELEHYAYKVEMEADYEFGFKFMDISNLIGAELKNGFFNIKQKKVLSYE